MGMHRRTIALLLAATLVAAGCGSSHKKGGLGAKTSSTASTTTATTKKPYKPAKDAVGCVKVALPRPKGPGSLKKPSLALSATKHYTVTLATNCGSIEIALDVTRAPKTASSFAALVTKGFYDGLTFHRIVPGFVVQGGDPLGNGQGGPGYNVVEKPPSSLHYTRGLVAMAKAQNDPPGASGSQFFIVTAGDAGLPPDYALVGKVVKGMTTVNRISAEPTNASSFPLNAVVIQKATIAPTP
jgi:peptidyl-prolyl cis-trans isomerase B (cyclophilin B)